MKALKRQVASLSQELASAAPGLGEYMLGFQMHIAKVWYAGEALNWNLAKFELSELSEGAKGAEASRPEDAAAIKGFVADSLAKLQTAVTAKDKSKFETSYMQTVASCNACHVATIDRPKTWPHGRGFIKITVPYAKPVGNQDFSALTAWVARNSA